jgi:acyl-CoA synthetase (NDP forming)
LSVPIIEQLDPIFKPKSIAFIGASNNPAKWGGRLILNALESKFRGKIFAVNPREKKICGLTAHADVTDIPDDVDLAVFTIPAARMPETMKNCVKKGVKGGVMISADFAETGETGRKLEDETVRIARNGGLRFVGPNGNGIFSPAVGLNITPFPNPPVGPLGFISQSGMFGGQAVRTAFAKGFGLSKFIAMGNQADLTVSDYLAYLAHDPDTRAIAIYMEGFKDGKIFCQTAREVVKQKPVLILKGGTSAMGAKATLSHTASIAGEEKVFDGMCRQAGVIRVRQLEHLFIMAEALIRQPLPKANRIAVVGNGGQGVTTTDNLAVLGIQIPEFKEEDKRLLKELLPPHAPVPNNPVDFAAGVYEAMDEVRVIEKLASIDAIDGIITNIPMDRTRKKDSLAQEKMAVISAIERFCNIPNKYNKPVIAQRLNTSESTAELVRSAGIPMYNTTEQCSLAMYALIEYARIKKRS